MYKIQNLNVGYDDSLCFRISDLKIEMGQSYHLSGANGSGKTTCLKMLCGFSENVILQPASNCSYFNFSEFELLPFLTVRENLSYFYHHLNGMPQNFEHWCKSIVLFEQYQDKKVQDISTGQRQVLKFHLALNTQRKILCLDELFSHLDDQYIAMIVTLINEQKKDKIIISSSQSWQEGIDVNLLIVQDQLKIMPQREILC